MTYKETLKHPVVARLSLIQFISYFGTWFSQVAIFSMLVSFGADEVTIALTATMGMLPGVFLSPFLGVVIDKINFKKLMAILLVTEILMTIGFIFVDSLEFVWVLMILIFIRSGAASMLFTAEMALFPKIIKGEMLKKTNEIHSIIWSLCYALGMGVGGISTHYLGYDTAFLVDAFFYTTALFLLFGLHLQLEQKQSKVSNFEMLKSGFLYLLSNKKVLSLILIHASIGLTSFDVLITLLADFQYKEVLAVPLAIGWLNALRAVGLMVGPFFIGDLVNKNNLHYFFVLQGLAIILWAFVEHNFYISLVAVFFIGFITTTLWSYTYTLLQTEVSKEYLGRVISYNEMFFMISNASTAIFIGYSAKLGISLEVITICLGVGFILVALYYFRLEKRGCVTKC